MLEGSNRNLNQQMCGEIPWLLCLGLLTELSIVSSSQAFIDASRELSENEVGGR